MPTSTATRARLIVAGAALLLGIGLAAGSVALAPAEGVAIVGALGAIALAAALALAEARLVPFGLGLLAAAFLVALAVRGEGGPFLAAGWGVALLLAAELADWWFGLARATRDEPGLRRRRALTIGGLALAAAAVDGAAAALGQVPASGGVLLAVAGVGAVVAIFGGVVVLGLPRRLAAVPAAGEDALNPQAPLPPPGLTGERYRSGSGTCSTPAGCAGPPSPPSPPSHGDG